ncbi:MAG: transposase, partial [Oligoflexia bacterium]|nr:transposase [Oligoflexia bacterium]
MIKSTVAEKQTRRITYRLYPNKAKSELLEKTVGCCRFVWNYFLDFSICYHEGTGDHLSYNDWSKILTDMKKDEDYSFLNEVSSICLQQTLRDLELAYKNFFRRIKKGEIPGFPKFKRKFGKRSGCRFVGAVIIIEKKYLQIPKLGLVKLKGDLSQLKNISSYTIYESCGEWYVSFVQAFIPKKFKKTKKSVSLDKGVKRLYTRSDGEYKEAFKATKEQERLRKLQKNISRKKLKSGKWAKTKLRISRISRKIARKRKDYLDKASV